MAITDYLRKLVEMKNQLAANLNSMGVAASTDEKLNTLVPKVLECKEEQNVEFVEGTDFAAQSDSYPGFIDTISKFNIPDGTTSIGSNAFRNCTSLPSITIPDSVKSIGHAAFRECTSLANIYYAGTKEQWNAITKTTTWDYKMGLNVSGGTVIHYNYVPEGGE